MQAQVTQGIIMEMIFIRVNDISVNSDRQVESMTGPLFTAHSPFPNISGFVQSIPIIDDNCLFVSLLMISEKRMGVVYISPNTLPSVNTFFPIFVGEIKSLLEYSPAEDI